MDTLYWLGEYAKIFIAFILLMFVWPSVVFAKHLKGKDKTYRFAFCVTVQVLIVTTVVLLLGLCRILNRWVVFAIFYGIFGLSVFKRVKANTWHSAADALRRLAEGTYKFKAYIHNVWNSLKKSAAKLFSKLKEALGANIFEYCLLGAVILFAMAYFSYGVFQNYGYGATDMYVHHQWIDGLLDGNIFYAGVYPEAMHCFIYCLHVLFGLNLYSTIMLLADVQIIVTIIAAYVFLKKFLRWKFTPIIAIVLFLIIDLLCINEVYGMSRFQWTLPQEFGIYTVFLATLFFVRYLGSSKKPVYRKHAKTRRAAAKKSEYIWNDDLLIFGAAVGCSVAIHFYCTIILLLLLVPFVIFNITKLFSLKRFVPLIASFFMGIGVAAFPMGIAYASGTPFQGSIYWATSVFQNGDTEFENNIVETVEHPNADASLTENIEFVFEVLYKNGYVELYGRNRANILIGVTLFALILWAGYRLVWAAPRIRKKNREQGAEFKEEENYFNGYLPIIAASVLFMFVYVSFRLGLLQLIPGTRICAIENLLLITVAMMPVDMIFTLLAEVCRQTVLKIASLGIIVGAYILTLFTGTYRGYLYNELSRYNSEVIVADSIVKNYSQYTYTIVSPASELYQINRFGRHEELLRFITEADSQEYYLPTEYVFIFVEKRPLVYAQSHFYSGPEWLAENKYSKYYQSASSVGSEVLASVISMQASQVNMDKLAKSFRAYKNVWQRTVLESKAYQWCLSFMDLFPFEMNVYYEDDNFVCYYFKQNPQSLYNLAIEDWNKLDEKWSVEI